MADKHLEEGPLTEGERGLAKAMRYNDMGLSVGGRLGKPGEGPQLRGQIRHLPFDSRPHSQGK